MGIVSGTIFINKGMISSIRIFKRALTNRKVRKMAFLHAMAFRQPKTFSSGDKRSPVDYRRHLARLRKANRRPLPDGAISAKALWYEAI